MKYMLTICDDESVINPDGEKNLFNSAQPPTDAARGHDGIADVLILTDTSASERPLPEG